MASFLGRLGRRTVRIGLALQGGGAHGAFTWGVLDRLLEHGRIIPEAISGTSAGACNAVVTAAGLLEGGAEGGRRALEAFWRRVADAGRPTQLAPRELGIFAFDLATHLFSPYELDPLGLNPLRPILESVVDFERLRAQKGLPLLIAATDAGSGEARVFGREELSVEVVLASACLPRLHHAVAIGERSYWDGAFTSNPPILALAERCRSLRLLLVRIHPPGSRKPLRTAAEIRNRAAEIVFAQPLAQELARLAEVQKVARRSWGWLDRRTRRLARVRLDTIDGVRTLSRLPAVTRLAPDWKLLVRLRDAGRAAAQRWLRRAGLEART
jgi:NTE family protein